jgi:hypothetical protein
MKLKDEKLLELVRLRNSLVEKLAELERREKRHAMAADHWKHQAQELERVLKYKTGELAILSELLNEKKDENV